MEDDGPRYGRDGAVYGGIFTVTVTAGKEKARHPPGLSLFTIHRFYCAFGAK